MAEVSRHLLPAALLVHTGSSFSLSAALISHPTQVHVYCAPKESKEMGDAAYLGYLMDDMVPVQLGGDVLEADQQRMVALTARRLKHRQAGGDLSSGAGRWILFVYTVQ